MSFVRSLDDFTPPRRFDDTPFTEAVIQESADAETWATLETITLSPVDSDPSEPATRDLTTALATLETAYYRIGWQDDDGALFYSDAVYFPSAGTTFADVDDVQTRLARTLTDEEVASVELLLAGVAQEIAVAVGKDLDDITDPGILRFISIEAVCRVMANPAGASSTEEELGAYRYAISFSARDDAPLLTKAEELKAREAVFGTLSASVHIGSILRSDE